MNKVILMGRLTKDPELNQTASGISTVRFSVAVNRRFAKEGQQTTDFIDCVAWRQTAEFICGYFNKGSMIAVVGSIVTRNWTGQDGVKHYVTEVNVDEAYFTGEKQKQSVQNDNSAKGLDDIPDEFEEIDEDDLPF